MGCPRWESWFVRVLMVVSIGIAMMISSSVASEIAKPECSSRCGNLEIPYPFGMSKECYLNTNFLITCNKTHYDHPKAFLRRGNIEVTNISIEDGNLQILKYIARDCYAQDGTREYNNHPTLTVPKFTISNTKNKFTVIGCDTVGYLYGQLENQTYTSGCVGWCLNSNITKVRDGTCSGNGCCQLEIPKGLKNLDLEVKSFYNHTEVLAFNPCGYAFVIQQDKFRFSSKYIQNFPQKKVPLVLDWSIKNDTCLTAHQYKPNCLCGPNTQMNSSFSMDGSEYRCQCLEGFTGNPYLPQGCQNINECETDKHFCLSKEHCKDEDGSYTCFCPKNYKGDGKKGQGCTPNSKPFIQIIIGTGVGFIVLLIGSTWLFMGYKKWKFIQQKEKFFKDNGGFLLQQHLSQWQSPIDTVRIFTQEELEKATNKYDESAVVGKGGFGTVYKGVLDDGLVVAIKKSKLVDQSQTDQFINEVIVLSQINHRNVVRLLGCCLETQVPLLVYEFITNGTLFEHIHDKANHASLSWEARLKIASETAGVLSYLHSSASTPIIHRDIKSTNILLDHHNCTAKVSDFGASKLVPMDQTQLSTMVQGTLGYLDPEYLLTSELTEKSDVYSFGIVLMELITGKKAVCFDGPEAERNLAMYVLCGMKEDRLEQVVEEGMATEANIEQIKEVAKLAKECVRVKGEERPTMKEVAMELEGLRVVQIEHSWANNNLSRQEEMVSLLDETSESSNQFVVSHNHINSSMDSSIKVQILKHIPDAR